MPPRSSQSNWRPGPWLAFIAVLLLAAYYLKRPEVDLERMCKAEQTNRLTSGYAASVNRAKTRLKTVSRKPIIQGNRTYTPVDPSRVCVIAVDDRPLKPLERNGEDLDYVTATSLMHLLWAERHGYTYRRLTAEARQDRHVTWHRLPVMIETVKACDWTVFFDSDSFIQRFSYSLDDLRLRWKFQCVAGAPLLTF